MAYIEDIDENDVDVIKSVIVDVIKSVIVHEENLSISKVRPFKPGKKVGVAMTKNFVKMSKLMSLVLRHDPSVLSLQMDENGWIKVNDLIKALKTRYSELDRDVLNSIVETNDKKRFSFNEDKTGIRANQGHSIEVDLNFVVESPPELLYHGTSSKSLDAIYAAKGLCKMSRLHVHLSSDKETATKVGKRHGGNLIIFVVQSLKMHEDGYTFFKSDNGVWLTDFVPTKYMEIL